MALSLGASQKRALSVHVGDVILDFYKHDPPPWNTVGTVTQAELRRLVIERLREKDCADVADILEANTLDTAVGVIRKRFKTLREKKRREDERGAKKQVISGGKLQNHIVRWPAFRSLINCDSCRPPYD